MNARSLWIPSLLIVSASLWSSSVDAQGFTPCRPGATVRYVNGVGAPDELAVGNAAEMLAEEISHFSVTCVAEVLYLYNPSDGKIVDVLGESARQKASELGISISEAILNVGYLMFGIPTSLFSTAQEDEILERLIAAMQEVSLSTYSFTLDGKTYTTASLVNEFRDRVIIDLSQGTKVVLVAHSQGNFFANETRIAVNGAAPAEFQIGLAVVNVANATLDAPNDLYITSYQDIIIGFLIASLQALPGNIHAGVTILDRWGHGFVEVYLRRELPTGGTEENSMSGNLMALIQQALDTTPNPSGSIVGSTNTSLVRIDLVTQTAQSLGSFTNTAGGLTPVYDIAINPRGGAAVAISPTALSSFDPSIRALEKLPQSNLGGNALTFSADGDLYAMSGNQVYEVDPVTGVAVALPMTLGTYITSGDLTFDNDGVLFGTAIGPGGRDSLIRIDLLRETLEVVGDTGFSSVWGLYFSGGVLYGATGNGTIISIDTTSGAGTNITSLNIGGITGLQ